MEYDNNNQGSLWKADNPTRDGKPYYNGSITINNTEHKITMFVNDKEGNVKRPDFKIKVKEQQDPRKEIPKAREVVDEDPFASFHNEHEEELDSNLDLPF